MDYKNYTSAGKWYQDALKTGFMPSCAMMSGISQTMEKLGMSFTEAFAFLEKTKKLFLAGRMYVLMLRYEQLLVLSETERLLLLNTWDIIDYIQSKRKRDLKIYWQIKDPAVFDYIKTELNNTHYLTKKPKESTLLITYGTQYGSPIFSFRKGCYFSKFALVLGFSLHSHLIATKPSLYVLKNGKYHLTKSNNE